MDYSPTMIEISFILLSCFDVPKKMNSVLSSFSFRRLNVIPVLTYFDLFPFLAHIGVMSIALTVGAIAFFVIGLGMYKGADGLTADDA